MTYHDLLADAQAQPAGADFHALRMAYARSDAYQPYVHDMTNVEALRAALLAGDLDAALVAVEHLLAYNYLDIEAHMSADYISVKQGNPERSAYHRAWATGLLQAIRSTGSGQSFEDAYIVLSIPEEYTELRLLGLKAGRQRLMQHEGHWFDVLEATHPQTGEAISVYFNIDLPRGWLDQQMHAHSDPDS